MEETKTSQQGLTTTNISFDELNPLLTFKSDSITSPADIDLIGSDSLAVFDMQLASVQIYNRQGRLLQSFGKKGKGPGEFGRPTGMQVSGDTIYVLDFATFGINEFSRKGEFLRRRSFDGASMGFAQTSVLGAESYLTPANGKNGSLLHLQQSADSSFYFGNAPVEKPGAVDIQQVKQQIQNKEVPSIFKNTVLTAFDDQSYFAFLQAFSKLQRYSCDGELLWEQPVDLPVKEKIFTNFVEQNKKSQGNAIYPLSYATAMQITADAIYILINVPEGDPQRIVEVDKTGKLQQIYHIEVEEGDFNNFAIDPDSKMLYLTDFSLGKVYEVLLEE